MADTTPSAFVPGFQEDVFISYAHMDEGSEKWVSTFRNLLQEKLSYELRTSVRVWSDEQLALGSALDATLKKRIQSSALLIPIASPWYFDRDWCQRELALFVQGAQTGAGLVVGTNCRIVPVVKRLFELDLWPPEIRELDPLMVSFCHNDRTYPPTFDGASPFFQNVERLACDLKQQLEAMKQHSISQQTLQTVVVLAPMSGVRSKEQQHLRNWLARRGRSAVPSGELPRTRAEILARFSEQVEKADLVIHLLGPSYDMLPAGERRYSVEELLIRTAREADKRQIVWVESEQVEPSGQDELLALVKSYRDKKTEVITGEFSRLLECLPEELEKSQPQEVVREKAVYFICEKSDLADPECLKVRSHLAAHGLPLTLPSFQGQPEELRQLEAEQILSHDVTLIYYGSAPDSWAERKRSDTRKIMLAKAPPERPRRALYLGNPDAEGLKTEKYGPYLGSEMPEIGKMSIFVVDGLGPFDAGRLKAIL